MPNGHLSEQDRLYLLNAIDAVRADVGVIKITLASMAALAAAETAQAAERTERGLRWSTRRWAFVVVFFAACVSALSAALQALLS